MSGKRVIIVGAGPGGLSAAMLLAARGFVVRVFERGSTWGGRTSGFSLGDYRFDLGSTMLMMPFVLEEIFELSGANLHDEVRLVPIDPLYQLDFGGRHLDMYADGEKMRAELARFCPGSEEGLTAFLKHERARLERLYPVLQRDWPNLRSMISPLVLHALPYIGWDRSLFDTAGEYFGNDDLQLGFSFQSAYLGMSPWQCPGGFAMVPYVEHAFGLFHVAGGVHQLCHAMARVAERHGAVITLEKAVSRLFVERDRCEGVVLEDGTLIPADAVVINADATQALLSLYEEDVSPRISRRHLQNIRPSCSTFMLHLGVDTPIPLRHHTFLFASDYREEMKRIFERGSFADDLSVYVCNPSTTDPTMAPVGHSALYALTLVPNTRFPVDWKKETPLMRERMLARIDRALPFRLEDHVRVESITTPWDWQSRLTVSHGAVFGPAHSMDQLLALRLPNHLPHPQNVYLAGGGTSPGSGLPTIVESGRIASRLICEERGIAFPPSRPLPPDDIARSMNVSLGT